MVYWVKLPKISLIIVVVFCIIEFFMVFMHRSEALPKTWYDNIVMYRRGLSFLCMFFVWFCFRGIYQWNGHEPVEAFTDGKCTDDEMLLETFVEMRNFLDKSQSKEREIYLYVFLALIAVMNIAGFVYKKTVPDKEYKNQEKGQLKEALL